MAVFPWMYLDSDHYPNVHYMYKHITLLRTFGFLLIEAICRQCVRGSCDRAVLLNKRYRTTNFAGQIQRCNINGNLYLSTS